MILVKLKRDLIGIVRHPYATLERLAMERDYTSSVFVVLLLGLLLAFFPIGLGWLNMMPGKAEPTWSLALNLIMVVVITILGYLSMVTVIYLFSRLVQGKGSCLSLFSAWGVTSLPGIGIVCVPFLFLALGRFWGQALSSSPTIDNVISSSFQFFALFLFIWQFALRVLALRTSMYLNWWKIVLVLLFGLGGWMWLFSWFLTILDHYFLMFPSAPFL